MNIARYEKRVGAWLFDKVLSLPAFCFALFMLSFRLRDPIPLVFSIVISVLCAFAFYFLLTFSLMWISNGSTLGGIVFGVRAFHPSGGRIKGRECFLKCLMTGVTAMAVASSCFMLFTHTEHSIFDRLTNTVMIDSRPSD